MNPEDFLKSLVDYEKQPTYDYDLNRFVHFLDQLNAPQHNLHNVIHIGGTKGKGASAAIIASCLVQSGKSVGLFTSPHLSRINERIKINNSLIKNKDLAYYIKKIKTLMKGKKTTSPVKYRKLSGAKPIENQEFYGARTFFETLTAIAFLHFARKKTDFTIFEVGLGGRLDATNVTNPIISVITKIGYDHTNLLGNKLSQIAIEKAGIIKPPPFPPPQMGEDKGGGKVTTMSTRQEHSQLITIHQRSSVERVIKRVAKKQRNKITFAEDQHNIKIVKQTIKGSHLRIAGQIGRFNAFLPLPGVHQVQNLLLALAVINELRTMGFEIPVQAVQKGIRQTRLRGRFEVISNKPLVIFDCAHNRDSFEALHENIETLKIRNFFLIFGCSRGKDITYALKKIFPKAKEVVLVKTDNPRAMIQTDIYDHARKYQQNIAIASSVAHAIEYLKSKSQKNEKIIITGSFYLWQPSW